jgi:hypothetical protein
MNTHSQLCTPTDRPLEYFKVPTLESQTSKALPHSCCSAHLNTDRVNIHPAASRYSANKQRMATCHMVLLPAAFPAPAPAAAAAAAVAAEDARDSTPPALWSGLFPAAVCWPTPAAAAAAARAGPLTASGPATLRNCSRSCVRSWLCWQLTHEPRDLKIEESEERRQDGLQEVCFVRYRCCGSVDAGVDAQAASCSAMLQYAPLEEVCGGLCAVQ